MNAKAQVELHNLSETRGLREPTLKAGKGYRSRVPQKRPKKFEKSFCQLPIGEYNRASNFEDTNYDRANIENRDVFSNPV